MSTHRKMHTCGNLRAIDAARKPKASKSKRRDRELSYASSKRNHVKREAKKLRKRGFHTRITELRPGVFAVYRSPKRVE